MLDDTKRLQDEVTNPETQIRSYALKSSIKNDPTDYATVTKYAQTSKSNNSRSLNLFKNKDRSANSDADEIFSVKDHPRGISQRVAENNRLASQLMSKRRK